MEYKGYIGHFTYENEAKIFHGEVFGLRDVITFQGQNLTELESSFRDSVDDYLDWCHKLGEKPKKTL